jgi:hypothetical protein
MHHRGGKTGCTDHDHDDNVDGEEELSANDHAGNDRPFVRQLLAA